MCTLPAPISTGSPGRTVGIDGRSAMRIPFGTPAALRDRIDNTREPLAAGTSMITAEWKDPSSTPCIGAPVTRASTGRAAAPRACPANDAGQAFCIQWRPATPSRAAGACLENASDTLSRSEWRPATGSRATRYVATGSLAPRGRPCPRCR